MSGNSKQNSSALTGKDAALFKQLVEQYEEKRYKKAIKTADLILKKYPEHGETLAMKGLTLSNMSSDKKEEAYDLVRRGLKADLKSHVCWHVYGLLYRQDHDYREAIKCYLNALRIDKDNLQILRDLAMLQIQTRDLPGFVETRNQLLVLKPGQRTNWISFAVAHHANKSYDVAVQVLEAYEKTLTEVPPSEAYEHSELILYKALVLDEGGRLEDALKVLDSQQDKIRDRLGAAEMRASLLLRAGRRGEAEKQYRDLLATNPDHYRWHEGLQAALGLRAEAGQGLSDSLRSQLTGLYQELSAMYPGSSACKRIALDFLQGDAFLASADAYVRRYLSKGIPSLFMDLRPLYSDPSKASALGTLMEGYDKSLAASGSFPPLAHHPDSVPGTSGGDSAAVNGAAAAGKQGGESPQTRVWVLYYLAQHYDKLGHTTRGLDMLEEALRHTPTLTELYSARSTLLRHAGDLEGAVQDAEVARRSDLSDRYLNSLAVKALLKADKVDSAEKTATLFTKEGEQGLAALHDMQHMWFECASGAAHLRRKEYGRALKRLTAVIKHFDDIHEDQFDFHSYCMRKSTLRAYVMMLRMEDALYGNPFYSKAAKLAIQTYLAIADAPTAAQKEAEEESLLAGMSPEERKKYKLRKKKEEKAAAKAAEDAAAAKAAAAAAAADKSGEKGGKGKASAGGAAAEKKDPDPDGAQLAATQDPVGEAAKLVSSLKAHAPGSLDTQLLAAEVYLRRGRLLLALAAVQRAVALAGAAHPAVHLALIKLCSQASAEAAAADRASPPHPTVKALLQEGVSQLLGSSQSVGSYNSSWVASHGSTSLSHRLAGARALLALGAADAKSAATQLVMATPCSTSQPLEHRQCEEAAALLSGPLIGDATAAAEWRQRCAEHFPFSRVFSGSRVLALDPELSCDNLVEAFGRLAFL